MEDRAQIKRQDMAAEAAEQGVGAFACSACGAAVSDAERLLCDCPSCRRHICVKCGVRDIEDGSVYCSEECQAQAYREAIEGAKKLHDEAVAYYSPRIEKLEGKR